MKTVHVLLCSSIDEGSTIEGIFTTAEKAQSAYTQKCKEFGPGWSDYLFVTEIELDKLGGCK